MPLEDVLVNVPVWDDEERAALVEGLRRDLARRIRRAATVPVKTCPSCSEHLPAAAFSENTARPDGLQSRCRSCHNAARRTPSL